MAATAAADSSKPPRAAVLPARPLLLALPFLSLLLLLYVYSTSSRPVLSATTVASTTTTTTTAVPLTPSPPSPHIRMRRSRYAFYDDYLRHQLNKTLDPRLRLVWATRDWRRKVDAFARLFAGLRYEGLLTNASRALCVGARLGQEVAALRQVGVSNSLGIDLAPAPPLVARGDFHKQPFPDDTFDFEFSNVFDHALYPDRFAAEVERTLRPGGVAVLHVAVHRRGDVHREARRAVPAVRGCAGVQCRCVRARHRGHPPQEAVVVSPSSSALALRTSIVSWERSLEKIRQGHHRPYESHVCLSQADSGPNLMLYVENGKYQ